MRCFYDVLGVERTADATELKKCYYKASLKWHPDKNSTEEATAKFQEIQEAYRVLSDPQEKAWYDRHREEIMRGGQGGIGGDYSEERFDVFQFYSRSCFQGFDDGPKGFYAVFRKVFEDLSAEEKSAAEQVSTSESEIDSDGDENSTFAEKSNIGRSFPSFGSSNSDYESVVRPFYAFWEGFTTRKSYSWVEKYDTRRMASRMERRLAETENRKAREAARKQRSEEVRNLVHFVQRWDQRLAAERARLTAVAQETHARTKAQANQARQRNAAEMQAAWESEMASGGLAAQWEVEMEVELARLEAELEGKKRPVATSGNRSYADLSTCSSLGASVVKAENMENEGANEQGEEDGEEEEEDDDDDELHCIACDKYFASVRAKLNHDASKKHKKQAEILRRILVEEELLAAAEENADVATDDDDDFGNSTEEADDDDEEVMVSEEEKVKPLSPEVKLTKRAKKAQRRQKREEQKESEAHAESKATAIAAASPLDSAVEPQMDTEETRLNKNDQRKKAVDAPPPAPQQSSKCLICLEEFASKNKLFTHIKETGHAVLKSIPNAPAKDSCRKSKGKRRAK